MLSELDHERRFLDERWRRLEQVITYYLTISTAVIGATIAGVLTTTSTALSIIFITASLIVATVGHVAFVVILSMLTGIVYSLSHFYLRRQYFLDKFPEIRKYVEYRSNEQIREAWRTIFADGNKLLIRLFAAVNCALVGAFVFAMFVSVGSWIQDHGFMAKLDLILPATILSLLVFSVLLLGELFFISRRIRRARELSYRIFQDFATPEFALNKHER